VSLSDGIYWTLKIFFMLLWLIYLISLLYDWDGNLMWHITGIASVVFFIINVRWHMSRKTPLNYA